jgi:hypothetical protein
LTAIKICVRVPCVSFLQVGSDDDGYPVRLKLRHFLAYCSHPDHAPADDSPLYVFAHLDKGREEGRALLQDYQGGVRVGRAGCVQGAGAARGRRQRVSYSSAHLFMFPRCRLRCPAMPLPLVP